MSITIELNNEQRKQLEESITTCSPVIQKLYKQYPPDKLYLFKRSGYHRVTIYSYMEDETMIVNLTKKYNIIPWERKLFGIRPNDIEEIKECDIPADMREQNDSNPI